MNAEELITAIKQTAGPNGLRNEVSFIAMFDLGVHSSTDDHEKEVQLKFNDCIVSSNHPTQIKITLC
jgi:hypothetical protein